MTIRLLRGRLVPWAWGVGAALVTVPAVGQMPVPPTGPAPAPVPLQDARPVGPVRGFIRHLCFTLQDKVIGYPDQFSEPPLGFWVNENMAMMKTHANTHDFMLYRSDFVDGDTTLSPIGAQRLSLMAARLGCWLGPVTVEWTPDRPGLADARKTTIVALFQQAGLPVVPERVVVGPSPYPGTLGADANNNYQNMILRDQDAAINYSRTPTSTAVFGSGTR